MPEEIRGYKVFNEDWTCKGKQYTCPGEFEEDVELKLCESGMHFCTRLCDCFNYYTLNPINHVAEVIGYEDCIIFSKTLDTDTKCCTNKLKIVREIPFEAVVDILKEEQNASYSCPVHYIKDNFERTKANKENIITFIHLLRKNIITFMLLLEKNIICPSTALDKKEIVLDLRPEYIEINVYIYQKNLSSSYLPSLQSVYHINMDDLYNLFESKKNTIEDLSEEYAYKIWEQYEYDVTKGYTYFNF